MAVKFDWRYQFMNSRKFLAFTFALALIVVCAGSSFALSPMNTSAANPVVPIVKQASPAVVNIDVEKTARRSVSPFPFDDDPFFKRFFGDSFKEFNRSVPMKGRGSGFIVSKEGLILTNNHVVDGVDKITVSLQLEDGSKKTYPATIKGHDREYDLAVIKIEPDRDLPVLELGDSDALEVGEFVVAIGNPYGFEHTVTAGVISAKNRSIHAQDINFDDFLQTDAAINPGNSGGPLLDMAGKVIGINTAIMPYAQGLGFAIPVNRAKEIMGDLVDKGKVSRGWLGVSITDANPEVAKMYGVPDGTGIVVAKVMPGEPAEKSGLKAGDIIVEVNGSKVKNTVELRQKIGSLPPKSDARLKVYRNRKAINITVKLGERPNESESENATAKGDEKSSKGSEALKDYGITEVKEISESLRKKYKLTSENGLVITEIDKESPASYENGLREGDMLLEINLHELKNVSDISGAVKDSDEKIIIKFEREGTTNYQVIEKKK